MNIRRIAGNPYTSLITNFAYAVYNCVIGLTAFSWWFITAGAYYTVLTAARFCILKIRQKAGGDPDLESFAGRVTGILLVMLSFCIVGVNVLSALEDRGTVYHEIIMITIAAFTFSKITAAIIGMVKVRHHTSPVAVTLRNLSMADACVSILTLQRSMLVSFPGMSPAEIRLFNIMTGTAVWVIVLLLGINLIGGKYTIMAKSKLIKTTERISEAVSDGYQKIEKGVVNGYNKIEKGVVNGYSKVEQGVVNSYIKIEDAFVDRYLTKDGETVEEAKKRLNQSKTQSKP